MKVMQNDIFGKQHDLAPVKEKKPSLANQKSFPSITLNDGLNEAEASSNAMLIHKILEKRMLTKGLNSSLNQRVFMRILNNELAIKSGLMDSATATRDSLISFYVMLKIGV